MKAKMIVLMLAISITFLTYAQVRQVAPDIQGRLATKSVRITVQGFPLYLDILKPRSGVSKATYYAEGTARIENSQILIDLAPGFEFPKGGLLNDDKTRISPELMSALGL